MIKHGVKKGDLNNEEAEEIENYIEISKIIDPIQKAKSLVAFNPEDYNSWYKLNEIYLNSSDKKINDEMLYLTQKAIQENPKSYQAWHHRFLYLKKPIDDKIKERESKLCKILFSHDKRNFHCWNYCIKTGIRMPLDFDNYSSMGPYFSNSIELLWTDPKNEISWRYYHKVREVNRLNPIYIRKTKDDLKIHFKQPFEGLVSIFGYKIGSNGDYMKVLEVSNCLIDLALAFTIEMKGNIDKIKFKIQEEEFELTEEKEPELIDQILKLEPKSIFLLKEKLEYTKDINKRAILIKELISIDSLRKTYYKHLENRIEKIFVRNK